MGYKSHAHYQLETRMAKTPQGAEEFLLRVWEPGLERAKEERAAMQDMVGGTIPKRSARISTPSMTMR